MNFKKSILFEAEYEEQKNVFWQVHIILQYVRLQQRGIGVAITEFEQINQNFHI